MNYDWWRFWKVITEIFRNTDPVRCGLRVGSVVTGLRIRGADSSGTLGAGLAAQTELVLENMRACVESAGGHLGNVAHVTLLMRDTKLLPQVNSGWVKLFPEPLDRPTYKFMPAVLPPGELVQIEFFAVLNGRRKVLNLPVVAHTNPIPMAVRVGEYLFSSRILPMNPATGTVGETAAEQAAFVFENATQILSLGDMDWSNVSQGRVFATGSDGFSLISSGWQERAGRAPAPVLHRTSYQAGRLAVMLELIASTGE